MINTYGLSRNIVLNNCVSFQNERGQVQSALTCFIFNNLLRFIGNISLPTSLSPFIGLSPRKIFRHCNRKEFTLAGIFIRGPVFCYGERLFFFLPYLFPLNICNNHKNFLFHYRKKPGPRINIPASVNSFRLQWRNIFRGDRPRNGDRFVGNDMLLSPTIFDLTYS